MAAEAFAVLLLFLLLGVAAPLALWRLVESERDDGPELDRTVAERAARRDTRDERRD